MRYTISHVCSRHKIMKKRIKEIFQESIQVKQEALDFNLDLIVQAAEMMISTMKKGAKVLFFGNGGSAADSQHIAAEFIGRFQKERRALPALALTTDSSILTCLGNDYGYESIFMRQIEGLGKKDDIAFGISTSGNSINVIKGFEKAKELGLKVIALTGCDGGQMAKLADIHLNISSRSTARIQEAHLCVEHTLCELVEEALSKT